MDLLTLFGNVYTFPNTQIDISDNFGDLVTRTRRLPGADGGFDELGGGRGLNEVGSVRADFWLFYDSRAEATAKIDAIYKMLDVGVQRLFKQQMDRTKSERYCWARLDNINIPQAAKDQPHKRVRVQLTFQVSDPFWYSVGNGAVWAGGAKYGDGTKWSGGSFPTVFGSQLLTLTHNGNAYTQPTIALRVNSGFSCTDPVIRRVVNGEVIDEVVWYGTLIPNDRLFIDCRKLSVRLNDKNAYNHQFRYKTAHWMRLMPGTNSIQVKFGLSSNVAEVVIRWLERYT